MLTSLMLQLVAGAAGGNLAALLRRGGTHGLVVNSLVGAVGGVGGGSLLGGALAPGLVGDGISAAIAGTGLSLMLGLLRKRASVPSRT